ncbi:sensor histidine kinase [Clostridium neuense]|uniref:histidine kinase n=1 Tax=Clostridium neuense TaxID=1728934 RepID=A0ABW8TIG9_9CLOT
MNICIPIFIGIICIILILRDIYISSQINEINKTLSLIRKGNFNARLRFYSGDRRIKELGINMNAIMEEFQEIYDKKEYLEESRKRMIANISHDLRTPLTSVLGYLEAVKKDENLSLEEKNKYWGIAYSKAKKLYLLLEDFFQMSKLDAGDIAIKKEKVNLTDTVKEAIASFYNEFVNKGIEPSIELPKEDLFVLADVKAVDRILFNLLSNAFRYGTDGKVIGIKIRKEKLNAWVEVWNMGKNIPEKDIPYVFDRLYTAESSRNEEVKGSGLGLAIVKSLVEKLNGEVSVCSNKNERTTFSFSLPLY